MYKHDLRIFLLLAVAALLQACAAAIVGGAAGVSVATDKRTTGTVIEDQSIELKALRAFSDNKEISDKAHLNVTSYNTIVLVTGEAPDEALRQQAIDLVSSIPKVSHVHNEITIAAPSSSMSRSSDSLITAKVKTQLIAEKNVSSLSIKVVTDKGVVYLMGMVSRLEAEIATEIARQTSGVQKVVMLFEYTD
ncbi:MAG: yraP [Gammaproteobacteria bacterium]|nr:yraP [Gammaproteobacteria bacterium]